MYEIVLIVIGGILGCIVAKATMQKTSVIHTVQTDTENKRTAQQKEKEERKTQIIDFLQRNGRVANNDIEKLLGVSDATATNYLEELEKENQIIQHGSAGRSVYYSLK